MPHCCRPKGRRQDGWGEVVAVFFILKAYIFSSVSVFFILFDFFYSLYLPYMYNIYKYIYHIFAIYPWDIDVYLCFNRLDVRFFFLQDPRVC